MMPRSPIRFTSRSRIAIGTSPCGTEDAVRIAKKPTQATKEKSLLSRSVLASICRDLDLSSDLMFEPSGKPQLLNHARVGVSLAHSGEFGAAVVNLNGLCGIDVESNRDVFPAFAADVFAISENQEISRHPPCTQVNLKFRLWSLREALSKALGGSVFDIISENFQFFLHEMRWQLSDARWQCHELFVDRSVSAALAFEGAGNLKFEFGRF